MSFAVLHMQKFKASGVKGIQFHNQRERESRTNPDIDKTRTHLNYDLSNQNPINYNEKVKRIISENVVTDRAIRKDAVVMCNFILTSDKKFFNGLSDSEQTKFFQKSYEFFKNRYGENRIVASIVHLDESTPHMHLSLVPVTEDKKLSCKRMFGRNELQSLQSDFPKFLQDNGFDLKRGLDAEGKNKHIETQKLKAMKAEEKVKALENELKGFKKELASIKAIKIPFDGINSIQGKFGLLNKNKITIPVEDLEKLKTTAKKYHVLESKIDFLERDNKDMQSDIDNFYKVSSKKQNYIRNLENKIGDQNKIIEKLENQVENAIGFLKETDQVDEVTNWIKEKKSLEKDILPQKDFDFEL